ncbi:MAG: formate dehydrogenase accessory sulfurtransferase FdhD [Candidatus Methylumidiphilus alinenensis]|uniref:Sulfur carrier protein FdhD n=1 Tax=Candidatus Methylumidiphilus alinenensis TaxID=2202197 RepID=A0A2W4QKD0_9GAMM|nr:MAG: formate dehydrogenase accessory sulfurtransferase FdhD [Candidatus Methylumidiphilus alinenensis]
MLPEHEIPNNLPLSWAAGFERWTASNEYLVERWQGDAKQQGKDAVIEEAPVALFYNNQPHVVMLATPLDLEDFALGFSLTEGIIDFPQELSFVEAYHREEGIELWMRIPPERFDRLAHKERNLTGRTGCGLCGAATIAQAVRHPAPLSKGVTVPVQALRQALQNLGEHQSLNNRTGAVHGAAWVVPTTGIQTVREDVGRHNALDKLIGALVKSGVDFDQGFAIVTSRASFEMVQKCASVGISFMAAISAPTGLAIRLAEETGFTLLGFARGDRHTVYANPQRLVL